MRLINTDGMSFFGPGSEWFWTMAQFVLVAVTLIGIYYQLRVARSANAFEQLKSILDEWESERMARQTLEIYVALRDGVDLVNIPEGASTSIMNYLETVASLIRAGHIDRKLIYEFMGSRYRWWWVVLAPNIRRARQEAEDPAVGEHFEWLVGVMADMDRKTGVRASYDEAHLPTSLDRRIQNTQDRMRAAEELRAVIVRPMSTATVTPSAPVGEGA